MNTWFCYTRQKMVVSPFEKSSPRFDVDKHTSVQGVSASLASMSLLKVRRNYDKHRFTRIRPVNSRGATQRLKLALPVFAGVVGQIVCRIPGSGPSGAGRRRPRVVFLEFLGGFCVKKRFTLVLAGLMPIFPWTSKSFTLKQIPPSHARVPRGPRRVKFGNKTFVRQRRFFYRSGRAPVVSNSRADRKRTVIGKDRWILLGVRRSFLTTTQANFINCTSLQSNIKNPEKPLRLTGQSRSNISSKLTSEARRIPHVRHNLEIVPILDGYIIFSCSCSLLYYQHVVDDHRYFSCIVTPICYSTSQIQCVPYITKIPQGLVHRA